MEKEGTDNGAEDTIELVVGFEALDDILEERLKFCRGKLVRGGCRCRDEWS